MEKYKIEFIRVWVRFISNYYPFVCKEVSCFIACQMALESSFGSSRLAVENENFSGMKLPRTRISTAYNLSSKDDKFAAYYGALSCLIDYFLLFEFNKIGRNMFQSLKSFKLALVQIGYCPEKDYISRIEKIYNQFINLNLSQNEQTK